MTTPSPSRFMDEEHPGTRTKRMQARASMLAELGHAHNLTNDELADMTPADWERLIELARRQSRNASK